MKVGPTGGKLELLSQQSTGLPLKALFYTRTPMLLIDLGGVIVDTNAAARELLGRDLAGCKGQHYTYLLNGVRPRTEGSLLPADGMAITHFATPVDDIYARRMPQLDTVDLRVATVECCYHSARHGPVPLRVSEVPCIDTESGACAGSLVSLEVADLPTLTAFQRGVDRRLAREVMWEVYAASYDRILPELPFYREVVERHYGAMSNPAISTVLDIGAGTGSVTVRLLGAGKWVTAVDVNRAMLEKMDSKREAGWRDRLTVIEDTAERLPHLRDGAFDGVTVLLAFFDMDDPIAALAEAQRLLKPGGTLVVTEPRAQFNVVELMTAAEEALRSKGLLDRLAGNWKRIQTVAPLIRDAVQDTHSRKIAIGAKQDWHAEAIFDTLALDGFTGLTFQEAHIGNCASITGCKAIRSFGLATAPGSGAARS
jgi:ubiquinone/menaquinone biosynthesis C-methylase UbiE